MLRLRQNNVTAIVSSFSLIVERSKRGLIIGWSTARHTRGFMIDFALLMEVAK